MLSVGLFADGTYPSFGWNGVAGPVKGLFYDGHFGQISAQAIDVVVGFLWAWGITWIIFTVAKRFMQIRVSPEVEIAGTDEGEFGQVCYPDFVLVTETDTGIPHELVGAPRPGSPARRYRRAITVRGGRQHVLSSAPPTLVAHVCCRPVSRGGDPVKLIVAIIKPFKLDEVTDALNALNISGITLSEVRGHGRQQGHSEVYRGAEYKVDYLPKVRLEILIDDGDAQPAIDAIMNAGRTGEIGDGKIAVLPVETVVRIRTGEVGVDAL